MRPNPPQDLPHRLANEATDLFFTRVAAQLAPLGADRAAALLAHLATGKPADVPADTKLFKALRLDVFRKPHDLTLYERFDQLPTAVALRWAKLIAAALAPHASSFGMAFPDGRHWPEALLMYSAGGTILGHMGSATADKVPATTFEALLEADALAPSALLAAAVSPPIGEHDPDLVRFRQRLLTDMPGYADHLDRHLETLRPSLAAADAASRLHTLKLLAPARGTTLARVAAELAGLAKAQQRGVRLAAEKLLHRDRDVPPEPQAAFIGTDAPTDDTLERFWTLVRQSIDVDNSLERELHAKYKRQGHAVRLKLTRQPGAEMAEALRHCLHAEGWRDGPRPRVDRLTAWNHMAPAMVALAEAGDLSPDAALRLLWFFDVLEDGGLLEPVWDVFTAMRRRTGHPTLLALRSLVEAAGVPGDVVTSAWPRYGAATEADWPGEAVWPYLQTHRHEVVRDLEARLGSRNVMYRAIAAMPSPPEPLLAALFEIALGSGKARAKDVQAALAGHPELPRRLAAARADKRAAVRKNAEAWAERLG